MNFTQTPTFASGIDCMGAAYMRNGIQKTVNSSQLTETDVLNMSEADARYALKGEGGGNDCGLTPEEVEKLSIYANAEGRSITPALNLATEVGHTYTVTAKGSNIDVTASNGTPLCSVPAGSQLSFVAIGTTTKLSSTDCAITENFKGAAHVVLSGGGSSEGGSGGGSGGELPEGFEKVEYLQGDGNQVIDTLLTPTFSTGFRATVRAMTLTGYNAGTQNKTMAPGFWIRGAGDKLILQYGQENAANQYLIASEPKQKKTVEINFLNSRVMGESGGNMQAINTPTEEWIWHFTIFCSTFNGDTSYDKGGVFRVYSWQHTEKEQIVRDFIPALDPTGAPCLFDKVSKLAFYNKGTGDFSYSAEVATYALRRGVPDWGKLTPTGLRRLYKVPATYEGELYDFALANKYKPIVETEKPEEGFWEPVWRETSDEIVLVWEEVAQPAEE